MPDTGRLDLSKISQKSIIRFLKDEGLNSVSDFEQLEESGGLVDNSFHHHFKEFVIKAPLDQVWQTYLNTGPKETWTGVMDYGFTYNGKERAFNYAGDPYGGLKEGQILFLNLKMLFGLVDITVTHKIMEINEDDKYLYICYLKKNKSLGCQHINFSGNKSGHTIVSHKTRYKSDSDFRDKKIYPIFHSWIITHFHNTLRQKAEK